MGLKSVPSTLAAGYFIAVKMLESLPGILEGGVHTEIYGPDASACCYIENIVYSFADGCQMQLSV
jgi:hypothetical protein